MIRILATTTLTLGTFVSAALADDDIVIADFESDGFGEWTIEGEAFGRAPVDGAVGSQRTLSGYLGEGVANSFTGGVNEVGSLISPAFTIERDRLNFLLGAGYVGDSSVKLLVSKDGAWHTVHTVRAREYATWKSQSMRWVSWDVSEIRGLQARLEIVDNEVDEEGFIVVDHVVQSSEDYTIPPEPHARTLEITQNYLHFPVDGDAPQRLVKLQRDGESLREFEIQFSIGEPDYWVYLETHDFRGESLSLLAEQRHFETENILEAVGAGAEPKNFETYYKETYRPQFHFTSPRGWNNDPNGMVYYDGEYHLFYQRNPFGWDWGNMTWGHAVSNDMLHWEHLPDALHPDASGTMFSGTGVVDKKNVAGFKTGDEDPIVLFYTSAGGTNPWSEGVPHTQSIAYSNDRGRTWTKYAGNPIIENIAKGNRDPKVLWHEPTQQWSMVLFLVGDELAFFTSDNLIDWTEHSRIKGFFECPELFELPVDGDPNNMKWVLYGAAGDYILGNFDGKKFTPETEIIRFSHSRYFYASQTFNNIPEEDGRRIQIGWARYVETPGMPFNQMMNFPVTLTLRTTKDGIRMCPMPIREIEKLYASEKTFIDGPINPGENILSEYNGDLYDIDAAIHIGSAERVGFRFGEYEVAYNAADNELTAGTERDESVIKDYEKDDRPWNPVATLHSNDGLIQLRILVDRTSIEIFGNEGEIFMPLGAVSENGPNRQLAVFAEGGTATLKSLAIRELKSVW